MAVSVKQLCAFHAESWTEFSGRLFYQSGTFDSSYQPLVQRLADLRQQFGIQDNVLFHVATPPEHFFVVLQCLKEGGLSSSEHGFRRVVVEKPFGTNEASAIELEQTVSTVFSESQIFRVDHFLGKETVQNMLVVRFANPGFEPIWNRNYVDHVQITVAEQIGIETRAAFYEKTGVVRDMLQNHLLQLLCMVAMEPPGRFDGRRLRDETVKVLEAASALNLATDCVLGQYGPGRAGEPALLGYRQEAGVAKKSHTPTFVAVRLFIDNWRWKGVPFYLRTGKRLPSKATQVSIQFKPTPHSMFAPEGGAPLANGLTFRVQPNEGIVQTFVAKHPGPAIALTPVTMNFHYAAAFGISEPPRAYAWLLHDVMFGHQTLFSRADWIRRAWQLVDPIAELAEQGVRDSVHEYPAATWGPPAADQLLQRDGRHWQLY